MSFIAERMSHIDASGIRKVFALAANMKDPIDLSIGQPDYDVDEAVRLEACAQIQAGFNRYTQTWGIPELREECAAYYERRFGVTLENVMITSGVSGGLLLALMTTVNEGDEVLCADPYFGSWFHFSYIDPARIIPFLIYKGRMAALPDMKLGTIARHFGIQGEQAQDAMSDIKVTREIVGKLWELFEKGAG